MLGHQMQSHLELSQELRRLGRASFGMLELENARLLPLDAFPHLDDQAIDARQMSVAIASPRQPSAAAADGAAKATNEQLIVGL